MKIAVKMAFDEAGAVRLLNWLASENELIFDARPDLPGVYDSRVYYQREREETWSDWINTLAQGHEDCDALAAARAGELRSRGWRALQPGDAGYALARRLRPRRIKALVMMTTRRSGRGGQYHCIVQYWIGGRQFRDDPSARLGMHGGTFDPVILRRRRALSRRPAAHPSPPRRAQRRRRSTVPRRRRV